MESLDNTNQEYSAETTSPALETMSKEQHQRLFKRGLRWLGVGVFMMGTSFGINYFLFDSDTSFVTAMYVLTSLGALCILKCLADILGF